VGGTPGAAAGAAGGGPRGIKCGADTPAEEGAPTRPRHGGPSGDTMSQ
jgi:hypothetical protein